MGPVLLAIMASLFWGVGTALQKYGMSSEFPKITLANCFWQIIPILKTLLVNWHWMLGLVCMFGGMICFATALGLGDMALVQPLIGLTGVVAAFIGVTVLKEKIKGIEIAGIAGIVFGVALVGAAGGERTFQMPSDANLMFFTALTILLATGAFLLKKFQISTEFTLAFTAGIILGLANLMGKLLAERAIIETGLPFVLWSVPILVSIFSDYPVYIVTVTNILGGILLQTAYSNGRAGVISPITTIMSFVMPLLASLTIFGEKIRTTQALGIVVILVGTALLATKEEQKKQALED